MRYLIVDANHLSRRCHSTMKEMSRSFDGHRSGVCHGFLQSISYVRNKLKMEWRNCIFVWDGGRSEVRMKEFPNYKAGRGMEEVEFKQYRNQMEALRSEALPFLDCKQLRVNKVEADDLIGIYSKFYEEHGHYVTIYSGDHDFHQLVSDKVKIFDPKKDLLTQEYILSDWGVKSVESIILCKALHGDPSDAVPGIGGVGSVKAVAIANHCTWDYEKKQLVQHTKPALGKHQQWIESAMDKASDISKNLRILTLPRTWGESFYGLDEEESALSQLTAKGEGSKLAEFFSFCSTWELSAVLEKADRW